MESWTSAHSGHGCPRPNVFFKVSRACPKFLTQDVHPNDPRISAGYLSRELSVWAASSFQIFPPFCALPRPAVHCAHNDHAWEAQGSNWLMKELFSVMLSMGDSDPSTTDH